MTGHFEGTYYKHQKGSDVVSVIAGKSDKCAFIQIISNDFSHSFEFPLFEYQNKGTVFIDKCEFSNEGIILEIEKDGMSVYGGLSYINEQPIKYDIMGPFKYFPMQCRHKIDSMNHKIRGKISINGKTYDFTNGNGYIEGDSGNSFPKNYSWIQCNDFKENCSIMAAVADIPFLGMHFRGLISVIHYKGLEIRLATYLGGKIKKLNKNEIILKQNNLRLEINVFPQNKNALAAPERGLMNRTIKETAACNARFRFYYKNKIIFDLESNTASFEED